ncbi:Acetyl-coenzyme A synthetase [Betaproteobacteria bacterium MOLA814]|nr:Acetyl-coenzyme A synthetase [Betaproteobacteria bacterium MOLA814]
MTQHFEAVYRQSMDEPNDFWREQAKLVDWFRPFDEVCDYSQPPFVKWFAGGQINLCHNAVDRHAAVRGNDAALIFVSTETDTETTYSFKQLLEQVQVMAAILQEQGVQKGDRVLIYMPMIPEATFAMLACARIGAIHSVVFGGFASVSLASRIDDCTPKVIVSADAGSRGGKIVPYKPLLDEALKLASHKPAGVVMVNRGLCVMSLVPGRDVDYAIASAKHAGARVACESMASTDPSYILYTSGTTGKPKGVQRDTGGYAVAMAASMKHIYMGGPGETYFATSDIGWVVGHSYIVYGPLLAGMATIMYEGLPTRPDAGIWWELVEKYKVSVMFSAPTAVRVLKKYDSSFIKKADLSSLKALFLAGEPLDEPTAQWIFNALGKPVIDNYWQTETGWPILSLANGIEPAISKFGSPGVPMYGYNVQIIDENTGQNLTQPHAKGVVAIEGPLPPGCMQTIWGDDERFVQTYWSSIPGRLVYNTFDWGTRDADGYFFILGRTDDVINVAGHRLGTREIEESIATHSAIVEVAVVGVADKLKGQVAMAFAVLKDPSLYDSPQAQRQLEGDLMKLVDSQIGAVARPSRIRFVSLLPKTRSGKLLRRAIQAVCEHREAGDLTTMDDPSALATIKALVQA